MKNYFYFAELVTVSMFGDPLPSAIQGLDGHLPG